MMFVVVLSILCSIVLIDADDLIFQFYPEKDFQGKAVNVTVTLECRNLDEYTQGKVMSINVQKGTPYILHNTPNCSRSDSNVTIYGRISDLDKIGFGHKAASFELESW